MKKIPLLVYLCVLFSSTLTAQPVIVKNIKGYTPVKISKEGQYRWHPFQTLVMEDGIVLATGDVDMALKYPNAKVIDGKNRTLLPGLIDAHGHVIGLGSNRLNIDVRGAKSSTDVALAVQAYAKAHPELSWIKGRGWNQELWQKRLFPTARDLDEYVPDRPVWLRRVDGHAGWANRKALAFAGITKESIDPDGGRIVRDGNGEPTGVLVDNAMDLLESKMPKPTKADKQSALEIAMKHMLSLGLTGAHDAGVGYNTYQLYQENIHHNTLDVRIYAMIHALDPQLMKVLKAGYVADSKDMLSMRSVKLSVDGALGSRGAAMLAPYSDKPEQKGLLLVGEQRMAQIFEQVLKHKFQLNVHAIGDKGNHVVLNQFEKAFKLYGGKDLRNRIEHAQVVALADIPRFKTLNIIPSMQATHATSDMNMAQDRVGEERIKGAYAWRKFLDQGSRIAGGSDFPVELANPFYGVHAAVTRQDRKNQPKNGWFPSEAMSVGEALMSFTIDAAYAAHQDDIIGSLEKGKWADFILVDQDVFSVPAQDLWETKVLQTWVGGELKFSVD